VQDQTAKWTEFMRMVYRRNTEGRLLYGRPMNETCVVVAAALAMVGCAHQSSTMLEEQYVSCSKTTPENCVQEGVALFSGATVLRDEAAAFTRFRRACEAGVENGCLWVAELHELGRGAPKDLAAAKATYASSCERGSAPACEQAKRIEGLTGNVQPGGLPKRWIEEVINSRKNEIRFCYERSLQSEPSLKGKVGTQILIDASGAVTRVEILYDEVADAAVSACMAERIRKWRFPAVIGNGVVTINYPWVFVSEGSPRDVGSSQSN
jgi:TPR repeat protein